MSKGKIREFLATSIMKWRSIVVFSEAADENGNHYEGRYSNIDSIPSYLLDCYVLHWDVDGDNILVFV